ncbi:linear amide C-N hydrolase [Legionella yabuuchiae]|uniref:linear amide C-N hydrolase n=1 Tax=Legionella yabuuchiae TaxID=376727 RepID=UPI0010568D9D|nr:choloylglycine hydrolase family protein [Legionella yabuuchiae]
MLLKQYWMLTTRSIILICSLFSSTLLACTGFQLSAKDGSHINGRTVEFGMPLDLAGLVVPRHFAFSGTLPDGTSGLKYSAKYAAVGANAFGAPAIIDGVNEKGFAGGAFYFPGYASYASLTDDNKNSALAPTEFINWALTQFATVDELKESVDSVVIVPTAQKAWNGVAPFHYVFYDKLGKSIVVEPIDGKLVVSENPIGVFTNSPTFDWHLTNLSNYMTLSTLNVPKKSIDGYQLNQFGEGNGLRGLPGDFTPPSRFVQAAIFSTTAVPTETAEDTVFEAFHILNQFDIPYGAVQSKENGNVKAELTLATTVKDPVNLRYYLRTYEDQTIKSVDLRSFDLNNKEIMTISLAGKQPVVDISKRAIPYQKKDNSNAGKGS